jgi:hypothetical protein
VRPPDQLSYSGRSRGAGSEPEYCARRGRDGSFAACGLRRRARIPWAITRPTQTARMGASPTATTTSQDSAQEMLLFACAFASCDTNARFPRMGEAGLPRGGGSPVKVIAAPGVIRREPEQLAPRYQQPSLPGEVAKLAGQPSVIGPVRWAEDRHGRQR